MEFRILEDGYAYVEFDDGDRVTVEVPTRTLKNDYYILDFLNENKDVEISVEGDTEDELLDYMCGMINLIHGPGEYFYDLNKVHYENEDETLATIKNIFFYTSNTEYNPDEHSFHFEPSQEEEEESSGGEEDF